MITFSEEAFTKIKLILENNSLKYPRITLKKIGCAGNTLILTLEEKDTADSVVEVNGIKFAISKDALPFSDNLYIYIKNGLGSEIVIQNNNAKYKCKCGKSFR